MPTFLSTDILFFLLLLGLAGLIVHAARREHLRRPWRKVARNRSAMVSLVILLVYLAIAVLDSIRFHPTQNPGQNGEARYQSEPVTLLDMWLQPIKSRVEKTYSAPLASHAYAKEMTRQPDGAERWAYPRLKYGGAHLDDPAREQPGDLLRTGAKGLG
ncbi:MAG: ABC transporter permease, partial [Methylomagnum sp.]